MARINFERLEVFTNIEKTKCVVRDVKKDFANQVYNVAGGLPCHALALKIYNSVGDTEYNEDECALILQLAQNYGTPSFIDAINTVLNNQKEKEA